MKTKSELNTPSWIRFSKPLVSQGASGLKKAFAIWLMAISTVAAFGQGKVALAMDLPVMMDPTPWVLPPDIALAHQPVPTTGPLPSGIVLQIGLYGGTSSGNLTLISSEAINPVGGTGLPAGAFTRLNIICPFQGGVFQFFQVKIWDSAYASYEAQAAAGHVGNGTDYANFDNIFSMVPGTSITYPFVYSGGSTTWTAAGNETPLLTMLQMPEPSSFALFALGAGVMLVGRGRKNASNH